MKDKLRGFAEPGAVPVCTDLSLNEFAKLTQPLLCLCLHAQFPCRRKTGGSIRLAMDTKLENAVKVSRSRLFRDAEYTNAKSYLQCAIRGTRATRRVTPDLQRSDERKISFPRELNIVRELSTGFPRRRIIFLSREKVRLARRNRAKSHTLVELARRCIALIHNDRH